MQIITTSINLPPKICIYGAPGAGKSSFGSQMPNPVFIQTEGGLSHLGVKAFPRAKWLKDVNDALDHLIQDTRGHKTLVIDTLDWLERLAIEDCVNMGKVSDFAELKYGKGPRMLEQRFREILDKCDTLNEKGMFILFLAHAKVVKFEDPTKDNYDTYTLDLYSGSSVDIANMILEYVDVLGFVNFRVSTVESKEGFGTKVIKAKGSNERILYLEKRPAFLAKNRYSMGDQIAFPENEAWPVFFETLKKSIATIQGKRKTANKPLPALTKEAIAEAEAATEAEYADDAAARARTAREPEKYMEGK